MNLSNILKMTSQVAGVASAVPGFGMWAAPISAALGFAGNMVQQGNNNVNQGGVDVTGQLKGSSSFGFQGQPYVNPGLYDSNINLPKNYFNVSDPTTKPIVSSQYTPDGKLLTQPFNQSLNLPNMLPTGNINVQGNGSSIDPTFDANMQLPVGYNTNVQGNGSSIDPTVPQSNSGIPLKAIAELNSIIGNRNTIVPPTVNGQSGKEELVGKDMVKNANEFAGTMDKIGTGAFMLGSAMSLYNELNKKPSEMAVTPQFKTVDLDSNQSATINAGTREIQKGKNFQQRMMQDLGVDPMLAGIMLETIANDSKTKLLSESERTRQSIEATQEQLNANIQGQAGQAKMATDQFNIQKQMQENQMASVNISQSIMGMVNALPAYGQSNFARKYQMYDLFYNR